MAIIQEESERVFRVKLGDLEQGRVGIRRVRAAGRSCW